MNVEQITEWLDCEWRGEEYASGGQVFGRANFWRALQNVGDLLGMVRCLREENDRLNQQIRESNMKNTIVTDSAEKSWKENVHPALNKIKSTLLIVGHCPKCGAPIYGLEQAEQGSEPEVKYSCDCVRLMGTTRTT